MWTTRITTTDKMASIRAELWRFRMSYLRRNTAMLWYTISELSAELLVSVECLFYFMRRLWYSNQCRRIIAERCGGSCSSTLRKTRACMELSCLNGGSLEHGRCFCKEGYSGNCCEKGNRQLWNRKTFDWYFLDQIKVKMFLMYW